MNLKDIIESAKLIADSLKPNEKIEGKNLYDLQLHLSTALEEIEEIRELIYEGLPDDCVLGYGEVKFCAYRQGDGNKCKWCSDYE